MYSTFPLQNKKTEYYFLPNNFIRHHYLYHYKIVIIGYNMAIIYFKKIYQFIHDIYMILKFEFKNKFTNMR